MSSGDTLVRTMSAVAMVWFMVMAGSCGEGGVGQVFGGKDEDRTKIGQQRNQYLGILKKDLRAPCFFRKIRYHKSDISSAVSLTVVIRYVSEAACLSVDSFGVESRERDTLDRVFDGRTKKQIHKDYEKVCLSYRW